MKNWCWIIVMIVLVSSCLESAECVKSGSTGLVISFKKLSDGTADTVKLYGITAEGTDFVFYNAPAGLDIKSAVVSVNPYTAETLFTFSIEAQQLTLKVGYKNEVRFISEECGSDRVQLNLTVLETQFDSVRVVSNVLTRDSLTNIEIYN